MQIGELAIRTGETLDTLRYYDKLGLIVARRRGNGYRDYADGTDALVKTIRLAQGLGFTLGEIAEVLPMLRDGQVPAETVRTMLADKLQRIDQRLAELAQLRQTLAERLEQVCPLRRGQLPA